MSVLDLNALNALPKVERILALAETNAQLEKLDAEGRVAWALENLPGNYVLSSSFGIQAAVSLHLVNQIRPDIPVILTDTGYLFPETYQFIDELTDKLKLNLKVYRAAESAAWQEARYGKLWEQGVEGIEKYNEINKVEPMNRLLDEPTAGLDPRGRAQMIAIIRRIVGQGRRVVISSHDIDLIYEVSDAVYVLRHGEVLAAGDPGEVFACAETMDRAGLTQPWLVKLHSELGLPLCKTEAEFFQRMHNNAIGAIKEAS